MFVLAECIGNLESVMIEPSSGAPSCERFPFAVGLDVPLFPCAGCFIAARRSLQWVSRLIDSGSGLQFAILCVLQFTLEAALPESGTISLIIGTEGRG